MAFLPVLRSCPVAAFLFALEPGPLSAAGFALEPGLLTLPAAAFALMPGPLSSPAVAFAPFWTLPCPRPSAWDPFRARPPDPLHPAFWPSNNCVLNVHQIEAFYFKMFKKIFPGGLTPGPP